MATYKYSGEMRYSDDTLLWTQILDKERAANDIHKDYQMTTHFEDVHGNRFGKGKFNRTLNDPRALKEMLKNNLNRTQQLGFHRQHYLKDQVNHFTDPPYCIIKPGYRPSQPFPNENQVDVKNLYSFKPFGNPKHARANSDMFKTTFRSTLQDDSPFYKGVLAPYNVRHALFDPSHTFTHPPNHKTRRDIDFMQYEKKKRDVSCRELQHTRRETFDIYGNNILRLPERRDMFIEEEPNPLDTYKKTRRSNKEFFSKDATEKIDVSDFGRGNYLTAPKNSVGVPAHKNYFLGAKKNSAQQLSPAEFMSKRKASQQTSSVAQPLMHKSNRREMSEEKYQIIRKMLLNEKKATSLLQNELNSLSKRAHHDKRLLQDLLG